MEINQERKIVIACTGLDHVYRGFETFSTELFNNIKSNGNIKLLKGSGLSEKNVHIMPTLKRTSTLYNIYPFNQLNDYYRYRNECVSFGISLIPSLIQGKYDLIHFSDWILGDFLLDIRRKLNLNFKLLLSNGAPYKPIYCNRFDAIQQVALSHYENAISVGVAQEKMFLVPYGFDRERLVKPNQFNRSEVRQKYNIPANAFVIISLAALKFTHKRLDWLIREFSKLDESSNFYLVMAGQREGETSKLENLATTLLPKRNYQFLTVPYDNIPELLWSSDLMVLCSLQEGFGRVLCEAMGASVPLIVHPHSTAKWLIKCEECFVDMTKNEDLRDKVRAIAENKSKQLYISHQNLKRFRENFDWQILRQSYLEMYNTLFN